MKKIVKLFSLVLVVLLAFVFTGCSNKKVTYETFKVENDLYVVTEQAFIEYVTAKNDSGQYLNEKNEVVTTILEAYTDKTFVGLYMHKGDQKTGTLYLPGSIAPKSETAYEVIVVENTKVEKGVYSYPNMKIKGLTFAGWYETNNFEKGTRVAVSSTTIKENILHARYINLGDAGIVSLVCILIVFGMLALLWGIVSLFKFIAPKEETKPAQVKQAPVVTAPQKAFTIDDIKDEDMMAAALVATIDYHNETGEDVRVVSVKQIG